MDGRNMLTILDVPASLRPPFPFPYPGHQTGPMIEAFAHAHLPVAAQQWRLDESWTYVPAYWTSYACELSQRGRLGRHLHTLRMRSFLRRLDPSRRYFTISQHDDGLAQRGRYRPRVPIYEFSAGGCGDTPVPLLCDPHPAVARRRDLRASFVGALSTSNASYPIRDAMAHALAGRREYVVRDVSPVWGQTNRRTLAAKTADFIDVMCRSTFALCPRGYGKTSFRLYEAMQLGCIPVYLYDEPWLPYADLLDWREFAVLVHEQQAPRLHDILAGYTDRQIDAMRRRIAELVPEYFTMEATLRHLPRYLNAASGRELSLSPRGAAASYAYRQAS
jgi:hypothetical protein